MSINKGFSLIEIMVALGLLVVVGGIATTQYANYTERAKKIGAIEKAMGVCIVDAQVTTKFNNQCRKKRFSYCYRNRWIKYLFLLTQLLAALYTSFCYTG